MPSDPLPGVDLVGRRLRRLVIGLAAVLGGGFLVMEFSHLRHDRSLASEAERDVAAPIPVDLVTVKPAGAGQTLVLPGETAAWYESSIYPRVSGYVANWSADIGDHVAKGQVLAQIDTPELDAQLAAAKAKLQASEATVALRVAEAAFADSSYARWRDSPPGVVSEQEREDKKALHESAKARLNEAKAQVTVDLAELDRLNSFEAFKRVTSPFAGTITERHVDIGNLVSAGSSPQTAPLYRMAQVDPIRVFVDLPQSVSSELMTSGNAAEITSGDLAGRHFSGTITRTSAAIDPKSRTFRAEIDLPNPELALLPGMYVQVAFALKNTGFREVPAAALLFRADGPQLAKVDADGRVHFVKVAIARDDGAVIALSSGIAAGDRVVLNISNQIKDGDLTHINAIDGKAVSEAPK